MNVDDQQQLAFRALADPTRRAILRELTDGDRSIAELCDQFPITRAAVRKHLTILEQGQLIRVRTEGRERISELQADQLLLVVDWLRFFDRYWDKRLSSLKQQVERNLRGNANE